jgi:hypothetical protein
MSAVRLGEKNIVMTNAARAMPTATANPACCGMEFPARGSYGSPNHLVR